MDTHDVSTPLDPLERLVVAYRYTHFRYGTPMSESTLDTSKSGYTQVAGDSASIVAPVAPIAPVVIPAPDAPPAHHASFWRELWLFTAHAALVTGRSFENPAVVAMMPSAIRPEAAVIGMIAGAVDGASPATQIAEPTS